MPRNTERNIAAGEEVCISYGALSDAELLRIYGFVSTPGDPGGGAPAAAPRADSNPHNCVLLPTELLRDAWAVSGLKAGMLRHPFEKTAKMAGRGSLLVLRK